MSGDSSDKPVHALFNAVSTSKLRLVRLLIEGGVHVDTRNDHGQTSLLITCSLIDNAPHFRGETRESVVKYLIDAGADVNARDVTGRTPLIYAVITRAQSSVIFELIHAGAHLWLEDKRHMGAFDYAIQQENIAQVQVIVDAFKKRKIREMEIPRVVRNTCDAKDTSKSSSGSTQQCLDNPKEKQPKEKPKVKKIKNESGKKPKTKSSNRKRSPKHFHGLVAFRANGKHYGTISPKIPKHPIAPPDTQSNHHIDHDENKNLTTSSSVSNNTPAITQTISHHTCDPQASPNCDPAILPKSSPLIHESTQLCGLCKTVFSDRPINETQSSQPRKSSSDSLGLADIPELYRRKSTGSQFGLTKKAYDILHKQAELRSSMYDIFPGCEVGKTGMQPPESPKRNTMLDFPANELLVPDPNRVRSMSMPPLHGAHRISLGELLNILCSRGKHDTDDERFSFLTSAKSVPQLHSHDFGSVNLGSDEEWDDILSMASSYLSVTSLPDDVSSSQRDLMSPSNNQRVSPSILGKVDSFSARSSPIPMIVLTDYVKSDKE